MKPFREYFNDYSRKKIKQRSLKDAIKKADQKDRNRENGMLIIKDLFMDLGNKVKDYKSEPDSIIESSEGEEESESEDSSKDSKEEEKEPMKVN